MYKSVRQSMAWLHSWVGLIFGWLLFTIFITGSVSYYRAEISLWMQPQLSSLEINQNIAIISAYGYLQQNAPDAQSWYIGVANPLSPVNKVYWQKVDGSFESKTLNAATGQELNLAPTQGGDFFYTFHFQLYAMPYLIGRTIISIAAFMMLITLISGLITHKKIFTDFFTLRAFKGQRSYLDFHNVSGVIALPFFLTVIFTGLVMLFYAALPVGIKTMYPENPFQYFEEIKNTVVLGSSNEPVQTTMRPIQYFIDTTQKQWGTTNFDNITVKNPNTQLAQITFTELKDQSITRNQAQLSLNATTAEILNDTRNNSAIATLNSGVYGLHMARFAEAPLRLALFFSGILGTAMIASGLLLWSLKRQIQNKSHNFHLGSYIVNRLNITVIVGLPLAMLGYLYANRILTLSLGIINYEIFTFFTLWGLSFVLACITKQSALWKSQLKLLFVAAFMLPILNIIYLISSHQITSFTTYWVFLRVDLIIWLFAALCLFLHHKVHPIQEKTLAKLRGKIANNSEEPSV